MGPTNFRLEQLQCGPDRKPRSGSDERVANEAVLSSSSLATWFGDVGGPVDEEGGPPLSHTYILMFLVSFSEVFRVNVEEMCVYNLVADVTVYE